MRAAAWPGAAAAMAGVPLAVLAVLVAAGELGLGPALLGGGAVLAAALVLAGLQRRDLARLAEALDRAETGDGEAAPRAPVLFPPLDRLAVRLERVSRLNARRAAEAAETLRATEAIIEHLPDPLLLLDANREVLRVNAAARAAFGAEVPAVLRHPVLREAIDRAWREGTTPPADLVLPVPVEREVQASVIRFRPPLPDGGQALVVLSDRTRERAVERMRADFVANASHELRTPLASLAGFVETLRGAAADDPAAQQRFLAIMAEQATRMNRLIDDLLGLSRVELSEHTPPSEAVDLAMVAARVLPAFEMRLGERLVVLERDIAAGLPLVVADGEQMAQVVSNLVDNAIKYGREGGTVRLVLRPEPAGGRFGPRAGVVLAVSDEGAGIPRAHIPRLTERFYRVDKGRSRSAGGTGLGLAIVKHIVNRHRGRLLIDSEEGQGATFTVWLPLAPEAQAVERA